MRKLKKIKIGGVNFWIRPIDEFDLLGVSSSIPIFDIDREHETNWLNKAIDEQNDRISDEDNEANEKFLKHIVYRCTLNIKPTWWKKLTKTAWFFNCDEMRKYSIDIKNNLLILYMEIYKISCSIKVTQKINKETAESIYSLYKGMDYAEKFFSDTKLNAIEKYSFNRVIHNAGITAENRRIKANG